MRTRVAITAVAVIALAPVAAIGPSSGETTPDDADARHRLPAALSVFAPGQGGNTVEADEWPAGTDSQVEMYDGLPKGLDSLTAEGLTDYFKPVTFRLPADQTASTVRPRRGVTIKRDKTHNIPYVDADTRAHAMFGIGYARMQDRMWQMESFRAEWRAELGSLLGRGDGDSKLETDAQTFRLIDYSEAEYRRMFDDLRHNYGRWGRQSAKDLKNYVAGLNAYVDSVNAGDNLLPLEYKTRGITPTRWSVTDMMAAAAYSHISWGSAGPGEEANAQLLRRLQVRFGKDAKEVFDDLRMATNEDTPTSLPAVDQIDGPVDRRSVALLDLNSFEPRTNLEVDGSSTPTTLAYPHRKTRSNALLVSGEHSTTGHPIAVQGPQDGYGTPHQFDSEIVVNAPDFKVRGVLEISGPYPYVAGRGKDYGWSITILPTDQADTFAEVLCEPGGGKPTLESDHYRYKGKCRPFETRAEVRDIAGDDGTYTLTSERSVHGPVIGRATVRGRPVALAQGRSMFAHEEMDFPAHAKLFSPSVIRSAKDFVRAVAGTAYNIGWWYNDREDIAGVDAGLIPDRRKGASTDLPVWGTGKWDWEGFDAQDYTFQSPAKREYPQAYTEADVEQLGGVIAGWNNPSAHGWPVKDENWGWGDHHVQLLKQPTLDAIERKGKLDIVDLVKIHTRAAITDFQAKRVYPRLRRFVGTLDEAAIVEGADEASPRTTTPQGRSMDRRRSHARRPRRRRFRRPQQRRRTPRQLLG